MSAHKHLPLILDVNVSNVFNHLSGTLMKELVYSDAKKHTSGIRTNKFVSVLRLLLMKLMVNVSLVIPPSNGKSPPTHAI